MTRRDRLIEERNHDPYRSGKKHPDPSTCPECRAVYHRGRWQWGAAPADAKRITCPACRRVQDDIPGGILVVTGEFHLPHRAEILGLIRNIEEREAKEHPLKRIMAVVEQDDELTITTADGDLARCIGTALQHAWKGELDYHYPGGGDALRVSWKR